MRTKLRRLARAERLIEPYLQRQKEKQEKERKDLVCFARGHAMMLAELVLYGEPKLEEPLEIAWQRCVTGKFGVNLLYHIVVLSKLPGQTEQEKFQHVLDIAPTWLLKFTLAPITADLLGLKCPDLSSAPPEGQTAHDQVFRWPHLPRGTLQEGGPVQPYEEIRRTDEEWTQLRELVDEGGREMELKELQSGSPRALLKGISGWRRNQRRRGRR
jgi:hypothetical protein